MSNIYSRQNENLEKSSLFYPNEQAKVTIRPCEILFNKNGSSKYIFKDDWKEIATINNNTGNNSIDLSYSKKIITKEGVNKSDFNNFSEETRCFKMKNDNNDLNNDENNDEKNIQNNNNETLPYFPEDLDINEKIKNHTENNTFDQNSNSNIDIDININDNFDQMSEAGSDFDLDKFEESLQ